MKLINDMKLTIATARSRVSKLWQNKEMLWSEFLDKLASTTRTRETTAEYAALPKAERDNIKDVGGFVGGYLKDGKRTTANVVNRCMLCLDADNADPGLLDDLDLTFINAYALYSTHSHTPEHMRVRLIIPLSRPVTPDEYAAISRRVAADLDLKRFDPTTFEPARLMYWPSTPDDGEYIFRYDDQPFLDPDEVLASYVDWKDASLWPTTKPLEEKVRLNVSKQKDPLKKSGSIGAFCRAHTITDVLDTILSDCYQPTASDDRYTFVGGSTTGGLVVYDDKFAYSHHATDPAGGKLCNAFDLVRWHLFTPGTQTDDGTLIENEQQSIQLMREYASKDEATKHLLAQEREEQAAADFTEHTDPSEHKSEQAEQAMEHEPTSDTTRANEAPHNWQEDLKLDKQGTVKPTLGNIVRILRCDRRLKDISYNLHRSGIDVRHDAEGNTTLPWKQIKPGWGEGDIGSLQIYLDKVYSIYAPSKVKGILLAVSQERAYHPIRDYLESLPEWDGVPRVESMFSEYLGAADTPYNHAVARKMMIAAIARIYEPGIKFDNVVVLVGPQGLGKSSFFAKLGGKWFSDSLTLGDMKDKAASEKLQGYWILELGELAGLRKMDVETVKAFITRQDDKFRAAYGYAVEDHPRQCIIVGSTNNIDGFLRDVTGNRRYWPVMCSDNSPHHPWEVEAIVPQLWAEAFTYYHNGEPLYLSHDLEAQAGKQQVEALETDVRQGMIAEYLEMLLPDDWNSMDITERRAYLRGDMLTAGNRIGTERRTAVSAMEIWAECFGRDPASIRRTDTNDIFGMLLKIGGWKKYDGNTACALRRPPYGMQRCFVRADDASMSNDISDKNYKNYKNYNNYSTDTHLSDRSGAGVPSGGDGDVSMPTGPDGKGNMPAGHGGNVSRPSVHCDGKALYTEGRQPYTTGRPPYTSTNGSRLPYTDAGSRPPYTDAGGKPTSTGGILEEEDDELPF